MKLPQPLEKLVTKSLNNGSDPKIYNYLPKLWTSKRGGNADSGLPILLRLWKLSWNIKTQRGGLLCVLFLRYRSLSSNSRKQRLLQVKSGGVAWKINFSDIRISPQNFTICGFPQTLRKSQNLLVFRHPPSRAKAQAARGRLTFLLPSHKYTF